MSELSDRMREFIGTEEETQQGSLVDRMKSIVSETDNTPVEDANVSDMRYASPYTGGSQPVVPRQPQQQTQFESPDDYRTTMVKLQQQRPELSREQQVDYANRVHQIYEKDDPEEAYSDSFSDQILKAIPTIDLFDSPEEAEAALRPFAQVAAEFEGTGRGLASTMAKATAAGVSLFDKDAGNKIKKFADRINLPSDLETAVEEGYREEMASMMRSGDAAGATMLGIKKGGLGVATGLLQLSMVGGLLGSLSESLGFSPLVATEGTKLAKTGKLFRAALNTSTGATLANAAKVGIWNFLSGRGTTSENIKGGLTTMLYLSTPAFPFIGPNVLASKGAIIPAMIFDFALNTGISAFISDAYPQAFGEAKAMAAEAGRPDAWMEYIFQTSASETLISDIAGVLGGKRDAYARGLASRIQESTGRSPIKAKTERLSQYIKRMESGETEKEFKALNDIENAKLLAEKTAEKEAADKAFEEQVTKATDLLTKYKDVKDSKKLIKDIVGKEALKEAQSRMTVEEARQEGPVREDYPDTEEGIIDFLSARMDFNQQQEAAKEAEKATKQEAKKEKKVKPNKRAEAAAAKEEQAIADAKYLKENLGPQKVTNKLIEKMLSTEEENASPTRIAAAKVKLAEMGGTKDNAPTQKAADIIFKEKEEKIQKAKDQIAELQKAKEELSSPADRKEVDVRIAKKSRALNKIVSDVTGIRMEESGSKKFDSPWKINEAIAQGRTTENGEIATKEMRDEAEKFVRKNTNLNPNTDAGAYYKAVASQMGLLVDTSLKAVGEEKSLGERKSELAVNVLSDVTEAPPKQNKPKSNLSSGYSERNSSMKIGDLDDKIKDIEEVNKLNLTPEERAEVRNRLSEEWLKDIQTSANPRKRLKVLIDSVTVTDISSILAGKDIKKTGTSFKSIDEIEKAVEADTRVNRKGEKLFTKEDITDAKEVVETEYGLKEGDEGYFDRIAEELDLQKAPIKVARKKASPIKDANETERFNNLTSDIQKDTLTQAKIDEWKKSNPKKVSELEEIRKNHLKNKGWDKEVWHGSSEKNIKTFSVNPEDVFSTESSTKSPQLGLHVGTKKDQTKGAAQYRLFAKTGKSLRMPDMDAWRGDDVLKWLFENKIATREDIAKIRAPYPRTAKTQDIDDIVNRKTQANIRSFLIKKGYDSIVYLNDYEGKTPADSYIILKSEGVKYSDPLAVDNGKLITPKQWGKADSGNIQFQKATGREPQGIKNTVKQFRQSVRKSGGSFKVGKGDVLGEAKIGGTKIVLKTKPEIVDPDRQYAGGYTVTKNGVVEIYVSERDGSVTTLPHEFGHASFAMLPKSDRDVLVKTFGDIAKDNTEDLMLKVEQQYMANKAYIANKPITGRVRMAMVKLYRNFAKLVNVLAGKRILNYSRSAKEILTDMGNGRIFKTMEELKKTRPGLFQSIKFNKVNEDKLNRLTSTWEPSTNKEDWNRWKLEHQKEYAELENMRAKSIKEQGLDIVSPEEYRAISDRLASNKAHDAASKSNRLLARLRTYYNGVKEAITMPSSEDLSRAMASQAKQIEKEVDRVGGDIIDGIQRVHGLDVRLFIEKLRNGDISNLDERQIRLGASSLKMSANDFSNLIEVPSESQMATEAGIALAKVSPDNNGRINMPDSGVAPEPTRFQGTGRYKEAPLTKEEKAAQRIAQEKEETKLADTIRKESAEANRDPVIKAKNKRQSVLSGINEIKYNTLDQSTIMHRIAPSVGKEFDADRREASSVKAEHEIRFQKQALESMDVFKAANPEGKFRFKTSGGKTVEMTNDQKIYQMLQYRSANFGKRAVAGKSRKVAEALLNGFVMEQSYGRKSAVVKMTEADMDKIWASSTAAEKKAVEAISAINKEIGDAIAAEYLRATGRQLKRREYYIQLVRDIAYQKGTLSEADSRLIEKGLSAVLNEGNKGFLKRVGKANAPVILRSALSSLDAHIRDASEYIGYNPFQQKLKAQYLNPTVIDAIVSTAGPAAYKETKNFIDSIGGQIDTRLDPIQKVYRALLGNATVVRLSNPFVWAKQPMSVFNYVSEFGTDALAFSKVTDMKFINRVLEDSPYLRSRWRDSNFDVFLDQQGQKRGAYLYGKKTVRSVSRSALKWGMSKGDKVAIYKGIMMAKYDVDKTWKGAKDAEYYKEVARRIDIATQRTQVATENLHRSGLSRDPNVYKRSLVYLFGAREKNWNIIARAAMDFKKNPTGKQGGLAFRDMAAIMIAQASAIAAVNLGQQVLFKDEDEDIKIKQAMIDGVLDANIGNIPTASAWLEPITNTIRGKGNFKNSNPLYSLHGNASKFISSVKKFYKYDKDSRDMRLTHAQRRAASRRKEISFNAATKAAATEASELFGVPINQLYKLRNTPKKILDLVDSN